MPSSSKNLFAQVLASDEAAPSRSSGSTVQSNSASREVQPPSESRREPTPLLDETDLEMAENVPLPEMENRILRGLKRRGRSKEVDAQSAPAKSQGNAPPPPHAGDVDMTDLQAGIPVLSQPVPTAPATTVPVISASASGKRTFEGLSGRDFMRKKLKTMEDAKKPVAQPIAPAIPAAATKPDVQMGEDRPFSYAAIPVNREGKIMSFRLCH